MKFQRRNCVVDAVQWFKPGDHPAVEIQSGHSSIATEEGWRKVVPGDWIVTNGDGGPFPMSDHLFFSIYEPIAEAEIGRNDQPRNVET
ncbi:hypothetical protein PQQ52_34220 [Paraburkholderia sediminicola]|uniref:hypothetical protein n=1 Tax=Paraburkholderia sediminicola TaxID=458836 RepID=UPI0038BB66DB